MGNKLIVGGLEPVAKTAFKRAQVGLTTRVQRINGRWVWLLNPPPKKNEVKK